MRRILATALTRTALIGTALAGTAVTALPASAAGVPPGPALTLTVALGEPGTPPSRLVSLSCDPPRGTHPRPVAACDDLAKTGGDLTRPPGTDPGQPCFMIYAPVTVTATGRWRDHDLRFQATYPNNCVRRVRSGAIFDFLPAADA